MLRMSADMLLLWEKGAWASLLRPREPGGLIGDGMGPRPDRLLESPGVPVSVLLGDWDGGGVGGRREWWGEGREGLGRSIGDGASTGPPSSPISLPFSASLALALLTGGVEAPLPLLPAAPAPVPVPVPVADDCWSRRSPFRVHEHMASWYRVSGSRALSLNSSMSWSSRSTSTSSSLSASSLVCEALLLLVGLCRGLLRALMTLQGEEGRGGGGKGVN